MNWIIPGTTLTGKRSEAHRVEDLFRSMFLAGGLTLSQVSGITGLEPHTIQNWVKRGFLTSPQRKRYDMAQLCRIMNIHMFHGALSLEQVCRLISHLNGNLADESDDLIDDALLYFMFVRLAAQARDLTDPESWEAALEQTTADYPEPVPGAREKLRQVLRVMLTAWVANRLRQEAESMLAELNANDPERS